MPKTSSAKLPLPRGHRPSPPDPRETYSGMLIDPPSPFAPREELEAFLKQAQHWDQNDWSVKFAIKQVKRGLEMQAERAKKAAAKH